MAQSTTDSPDLPEPATEADRIRLIGDLICKGILCSPSLNGRAVARDENSKIVADPDEPDERIVEYLRQHRAASPSEIQVVLSLSRSRTYRALQRLLAARQVMRNGERTTAAAYHLPDFDPSRN